MTARSQVAQDVRGATVRAEGLAVGYGSRAIARGIDLELSPGTLTAIVGPNGCGKSTLVRTLARLQPALDGRVELDGTDVAALRPRAIARRVAFLPQSPLVPAGITVRELVGYGRHPHQRLVGGDRSVDVDAVEQSLRSTGLEAMADRDVEHLSGGERQRVWVAMTLAQRTGVLLLDEPTTFLDVRHQIDVLRLARRLADDHGLTVAMVLHDLNQAAGFADAMVLLAGGGVVAQGSPTEVLTPEHVVRAFEIDVTVVTDPTTGLPSCLFPGRDP